MRVGAEVEAVDAARGDLLAPIGFEVLQQGAKPGQGRVDVAVDAADWGHGGRLRPGMVSVHLPGRGCIVSLMDRCLVAISLL